MGKRQQRQWQGACPAADMRRLRVLVLDDDCDTREALELLLCPEEGFEAETCGDVAHCLERLRAASAGASPPFDVLLLDLLLPDGHTGTEILEAAEADPHLRVPPIVVCTALSASSMSAYEPALEAFGARMILKPFDSDALLAELRAAAKGGCECERGIGARRGIESRG